MRYLLIFAVFTPILLGSIFLFGSTNTINVTPEVEKIVSAISGALNEKKITGNQVKENKNQDIPNQKPLDNTPSEIKGIYSTSWSAGTPSKINYLIDLIDTTEINALVVDIKDYSGVISYDIRIPEVEKYNTKEIRTPKINSLIKRLHDKNIYVVGRVTVFQDPAIAKARPDLAIKDKSTRAVWKDNKGLSWIDPSSKEYWDYIISIARDASARGFDEINFDYVRFPSDGNLNELEYPFYDSKTTTKADAIKSFFSYLREKTSGTKISADLFGLTTATIGDLGIGQVIEDAYLNFDYVDPMVYPSHYANGFLGYKNPAGFPYEVVKYSMDEALKKLNVLSPIPQSKIRPWLQDFDLGAVYDAEKVRAQIKAVTDSGLHDGWILWDPKNIYTKGALLDN